jgi:hypothetical protein
MKITKVVQLNRATGTGAKGPWALHLVEVDGQEVATFVDNPQVGMEGEIVEKNGKRSFQPRKIETTAPIEANALKEINDKLDRVLEILQPDEPEESEDPYVPAEGDIPF